MVAKSEEPRVLLFSQRNIFGRALFRCAHFEFEDIISELDSIEMLAPKADPFGSRHLLARKVACYAPITLNPGTPRISLREKYDLFFAVCGAPGDLLMLNAVDNLREACKTSVCLIDEIWVNQMHNYRHFLRILDKFDVVLLYYSQSVEELDKRIGKKCAYLPPGVDTLTFCPYPDGPDRTIDVYSMGRRSAITHRRLQDMAAKDGYFYLYDTIGGDQSINSKDHRALFVNLAKRSRYFIVNPGLIDRPEIRGNQMEIGNRYFEGAAAGMIMVGEPPQNDEFERLFAWPDSLLHLKYDSPDVDKVVAEIDSDPVRQERIRRTNVEQALLRHDWAYRWESILGVAGLAPTPSLMARKARLKELAAVVREGSTGQISQQASEFREPEAVPAKSHPSGRF